MKIQINKISSHLEEIAKNVGAYVQDDIIKLPPFIGKGYYKQFLFDERLKMIIINCSFNNEFHFSRSPFQHKKQTIVLRFNHIFTADDKNKITNNYLPPSVYITTESIANEVIFPSGKQIQNIIISIDIDYLKELLNKDFEKDSTALVKLLSNQKPFLFEELVTPRIHAVVKELENTLELNKPLRYFFHHIKALELIFLFLDEFLKRDFTSYKPVNKKDIEKIYRIRENILRDLSITPTLPTLALQHGMSESKMKKLFKQVFGQSIYQYYLMFRIQKAALLIREQGLTVSEAGYQTGFSNLSHFTRLFERYMGEKPKKYSLSYRK